MWSMMPNNDIVFIFCYFCICQGLWHYTINAFDTIEIFYQRSTISRTRTRFLSIQYSTIVSCSRFERHLSSRLFISTRARFLRPLCQRRHLRPRFGAGHLRPFLSRFGGSPCWPGCFSGSAPTASKTFQLHLPQHLQWKVANFQ